MEMARSHTPPYTWRDRAVRNILLKGMLPHPGRLRLAGFLVRAVDALRLPALLRRTGLWRLLPLGKFAAFPPPGDRPVLQAGLPEVVPAQGERRARVGLLRGCIQDQLFRGTNRRTALALAVNGCEVVIPRGQVCCGALASHAGEAGSAQELAARTVQTFRQAGVELVIVNAAGFGSNAENRANGHTFARTVRDATEFLAGLPLQPPARAIRLKVTYQDPCHLLHGQKIQRQPRQLLRAIPGVELIELQESDWCCGSAGVYNLTHPEIAEEALSWKVRNILASGAEVVASANPGCIMQIAMGLRRAGHDIPVVHVMDLLGWAYGDPGRPPEAIRRAMAAV